MVDTEITTQQTFAKDSYHATTLTDDLPVSSSARRICIDVTAFSDGRVFSFIQQLRSTGFNGTIAVRGAFAVDQIPYFQAMGVNVFVVEDSELQTATLLLGRSLPSYGTLQGV